ncbi:hypothetical protein Geob_3228 [Geotalea daltonii FRC-32]|uniref:Uncharacterized protein n=1 Tax=Geotalea daltonii (strain DSM 22248 / JCM 15807 / FRC-32) TaxID=316067 RepID=B9M4B6_GEODF|nr:hypothetical protein [Geotalea daltonii]ACM21571.1 hypothetical protein Geob_3228 [Geotalea daltonii FRC-32]
MGNAEKIPKNIQVITADGSLRIHYTWLTIYTIRFLLAAMVWDGFLLWFLVAQVADSRNPTFHPVLVALGVTGVLITYVALAHVVNTTEIRVNKHDLETKVGPFPWPGNSMFRVDSILKLESGRGTGRLMPRWSANVSVNDRCGEKKMLITNLARADQAEYIVAMISEFLRESRA